MTSELTNEFRGSGNLFQEQTRPALLAAAAGRDWLDNAASSARTTASSSSGSTRKNVCASSRWTRAATIQKGDFVLDMCAAPGSKTKQISEMVGCTGLVVANELEFIRTYVLTNNMKAGLGECLLGNTMVINHPAQFLPDPKFNVDIDIDIDDGSKDANSFSELLK